MNLKEFELVVKQQHNVYSDIYKQLPSIQKIIPISSSIVVANFKTEELYNQKYVLYVNQFLLKKSKTYINSILFHEFTHMADSINLREKYELKDFKSLMHTYSEIHASEIEMNIVLSSNPNFNSIDDIVKYDGNISIQSFMDNSLKCVENYFQFPNKKIDKQYATYHFNIKWLCYFVGRLSSLHKYNIKYEWKFKTLDEDFKTLFYSFLDKILNKSYSYNDFLDFYNQSRELTIKKIYDHNIKFQHQR